QVGRGPVARNCAAMGNDIPLRAPDSGAADGARSRGCTSWSDDGAALSCRSVRNRCPLGTFNDRATHTAFAGGRTAWSDDGAAFARIAVRNGGAAGSRPYTSRDAPFTSRTQIVRGQAACASGIAV